jgi:sugar O-acyltransferase (sialic acid O-acetyltransferase NeuD family)
MNHISILGSGGHARSLVELATECGITIEKIIDLTSDVSSNEKINGIPVVEKAALKLNHLKVLLAIGDNNQRADAYADNENVFSDNLVSPSAKVFRSTTLGKSNQIFSNVVINSNAKLGNNNIINTGAIIEHECIIGSHNHISVGAVLAGRVTIGDGCFIGANSTVIDKVKICNNVTIGAGSVVIKDITSSGTYVGNPIRKIK